MNKLNILIVVAALLLSACSNDKPVTSKVAGECVVLLHGLARSSLSMRPMKSYLEDNGYAVANIDYPSRDHKIDKLAVLAVEAGLNECAEMNSAERVHFVTHSLGGILVRQYFSENESKTLGRVVMLGPPNQGSAAVDELQDLPGFEWLNGPAGYQLGKGDGSVPLQLGRPNFEFGIIAGDKSIDPVTSAVLENPDDGRVSVSDTRLKGMRDFRLVDTSHAFMMQNKAVFALVHTFLASGSFAGGEDESDASGAVKILMSTNQGDIEIDLYLDKAPITAGNFLSLVDRGELDGGSFYRVVSYDNDNGNPKIEVIQGGRGDAFADMVATIDHETTQQTGILHTDGVISMARGDVGTASSEFFISIGDQPGLDYGEVRNPDGQGFAAFGKVVSGMDVVRRIKSLPADGESESEYTKGQILSEPVVFSMVYRAK